MTANEVRFKLLAPHSDETDWHHWFFPNGWRGIGPIERRDRAGRAKGKREGYFPGWFVLACNNISCPARAVVPVRVLTDLADSLDAGTRDFATEQAPQ